MGRKQKHPVHEQQAEKLMNDLLDGVVEIWTGVSSVRRGLEAICMPFLRFGVIAAKA